MRTRTILGITIITLAFVGAGCTFGGKPVVVEDITLRYWRTDDDPAALQPAIDAYHKAHPNVTILVTQLPKEQYEQRLLEALAIDQGPDLLSIPNVWLGAWKTKILPLAKQTVVPTMVEGAQHVANPVAVTTPAMTLIQMRNDYVEGASRDLIMTDDTVATNQTPTQKIFGLPLAYDTLALYYNKDLLHSAGTDKPPANWRDLQDLAAKLTTLGTDGTIKQSGAAIGGSSSNLLYAADILAVLMNQNGAVLSDDSGVHFDQKPSTASDNTPNPGADALAFYQTFANPGALGYSWNASMPSSLDAFVTGKTAFYFGYPTDRAIIKERSPRLDFSIAPLPQIDPSMPKNIARYAVETVSRKTAHPNEAWDFLQFLAAKEQVQGWLTATKHPTALRALVDGQLTDPDIAPFAGQVLTGRSWYKGKDWSAVEAAFDTMILARPVGDNGDYQQIVGRAAAAVNSTY